MTAHLGNRSDALHGHASAGGGTSPPGGKPGGGGPMLWVVAAAAVALLAFPAGVWASDAFTDVSPDSVHHDAVTAVRDAGVTQGCAEGLYCPDEAVRRDQMASFMDRLGALSGQAPVVNAATAEQAADSAALGGTDATELLDRVEALEQGLVAATERIDALEADNAELQTILAGVTRTTVDGRDTLHLEGMNLQLVNGTDSTDGEPNGLGNLIIGYSAPRPGTDPAVHRAGSHYLVTGDQHRWTGFGGLLAGFRNTASGEWASVTGGSTNTASGDAASVSGGQNSTASGNQASVSGGVSHTANGDLASISGGSANTASAIGASVSGGLSNSAGGIFTSIAGGRDGSLSNTYDSRIGNTDFPDN